MCYRLQSLPLYGAFSYVAWVATLQFLPCCGRGGRGGRMRSVQILFVLGMICGAFTAFVFELWASGPTLDRTELGSGGRPTGSSLCPAVWAGVCMFGTSFGGGLTAYRADNIRTAHATRSWAVARGLYYTIVLLSAVCALAGSALYANDGVLYAAAAWLLTAMFALGAALHPTGPSTDDPDGPYNNAQYLTSEQPSVAAEAEEERGFCERCCVGLLCPFSWLLSLLFLLICVLFAMQRMLTGVGSGSLPGVLVEITDKTTGYPITLQVECQGPIDMNKNFTIFLEHGAGSNYLSMKPLADALAESHRVCGFTRAGYAWSQAGPLPRLSEQVVLETRVLHEQAPQDLAMDPPFLLVGHSAGGQLVQEYARTYPDEVVGVVALDSVPILNWYSIFYETTSEQLGKDVLTYTEQQQRQVLAVLNALRYTAAPLGLMSIVYQVPSTTSGYSGTAKRSQAWAMGLDATWNSQYVDFYASVGNEEFFGIALEKEKELLVPGSAEDIPLLLVPAGMKNAGPDGGFVTCEQKELEPGSEECTEHTKTQVQFEELQQLQANSSSRGRVRHCPFPCDHALPWNATEFVVQTILDFIQEEGL